MNRIYFHIAKLHDYKRICDEIFSYLEKSSIMDNSELYLSIVGEGDDIHCPFKNVVDYYNNDVKVGENPILMRLRDFSLSSDENVNILYIHTKGASTPNNPCIDDWRKYMLHFNVLKYEDAIFKLTEYDTYGVDLRVDPTLHYSGNFWWSKSNYIKTLPHFNDMPIIISERHKSEFWICYNKKQHYSAWDCGINVYERHLHRYQNNLYE